MRKWLAVAALLVSAAGRAEEFLVYLGTYTGPKSKGIYAWRLDTTTGKLADLGLAGEVANPSFVTVHPNRRFLYAVSERSDQAGKREGVVSAFSIDTATGKLTLLNQQSSRGAGPCYVSVDKTGRNALVANYGGGSVAVLPVKQDGSLAEASAYVEHAGKSVDPRRQQRPYAHSFNLSPDNRFAVATDLGIDKVLVYRFDAGKGSIEPNEPAFAPVKPGAGPRHFAFHPSARFAYVINEIQSTVTAFSYDAGRGALAEIQTVSSLPPDFSGNNSTAEVQVDPSGRFLYGSNRGHDSIAVFAIDQKKGTLSPVEHVATQGKTPRNFGIDPTGSFLLAANQATDNVTVFRIDRKTGRLAATGQVLAAPTPVCVKFVALGR